MIKMTGCLLIVIASSVLGVLKAMELSESVRVLEEVARMLLALRGEIKFSKMPISDAFYSISEKNTGYIKEFCNDIAKQVEKMEGIPFSIIWERCVDRHFQKKTLSPENIEHIKRTGARLESNDFEMQLVSLELEIESINEKIKAIKDTVSNRQRIYRAMGVFLGLMIAIILI